MNEDPKIEEDDQEDFSEMLEEFTYQQPERGQVLEGTVIQVQPEAIILDVGLKRDAIVSGSELNNTDPNLISRLSPGMNVPVVILHPAQGNEELLVSLQKAVELKNWDRSREMMESGEVLELMVTGQNRGGLLTQFENIEGFIPNSHIPGLQRDLDATQVKEVKNTWIGKKVTVKIIEVDEERRKLVFSAIHAQEQRKVLRLKELKQKEGQKVHGQVVNVVDFGLFIDLDGVDGLVHVSELDWVRVENLEERFKPGDEMDLQILEVDMERERVTLSRKNLLPNPWEKLSERYKPGEVIRCKVARVMDFGAFVELPEGVQGLIPKNELGYTHTALPQEAVKLGETVLAIVLSIDEEGGRMALSMRQVPREKQIEWLLTSEDATAREVHQEGVNQDVHQEGAAGVQTAAPDQTGQREPPLQDSEEQAKNESEAPLAPPDAAPAGEKESEDEPSESQASGKQPDETQAPEDAEKQPPMAPPEIIEQPDEDTEPPMAPPESSR
jgi:small subunit ribosomal protein S1